MESAALHDVYEASGTLMSCTKKKSWTWLKESSQVPYQTLIKYINSKNGWKYGSKQI